MSIPLFEIKHLLKMIREYTEANPNPDEELMSIYGEARHIAYKMRAINVDNPYLDNGEWPEGEEWEL